MPEIQITITEKIAAVRDAPVIVCGNSDYTIQFTFDSEWDDYEEKTAEFRYWRSGEKKRSEVLFSGDTVSIPILRDIDEVEIGVYAGNLHTSTPAKIDCIRSITDGDAVHDPPTPDVYNQLMEYLAGMQGGTPQVGRAVGVTRGTMLTRVGQAQRATTVIDMAEEAWETGSGNINTGTFDNELTTRLRCNKFIPVPANRYSALISAFSTGGAGLESVIYWYTTDSVSGYIGFHNWSANGTDLTVPEGTRYFRLNLKIDNETDMVPADLASCAVTFLS